MKNMKFKSLLTLVTLALFAVTIYIMSFGDLSKPTVYALFGMLTIYSLLCANTFQRMSEIPAEGRTKKILDIIFSTFELHAHKIPEEAEFSINDVKVDNEVVRTHNTKIDSFEIHL